MVVRPVHNPRSDEARDDRPEAELADAGDRRGEEVAAEGVDVVLVRRAVRAPAADADIPAHRNAQRARFRDEGYLELDAEKAPHCRHKAREEGECGDDVDHGEKDDRVRVRL